MDKADDLLEEMEAEASKLINTPKLESLFRWAGQITDGSTGDFNPVAKRAFAIRRCVGLSLFNKLHEAAKNPDLDRYLYRDLYRDLYRYANADFYRRIPYQFCNRFDKELEGRTTIVQRLEKMGIFTGIDFQTMVNRFSQQQEEIKAARQGNTQAVASKSIHETWIAVYGLTDDLLTLSNEELGELAKYFQAVGLLIECKDAAVRVSPSVWEGIEDRMLRIVDDDD